MPYIVDEDTYSRALIWDEIEKALDDLPVEQRDVFVMHEMEDKSVFWAESFEMISAMVSKTISTFNEEKNSLELMPMYRDSDDDEEFMKKLFQETIKNDKWFTEIIADKTKKVF